MSTWIALLLATHLTVSAQPTAELSWETFKDRADIAFGEEQWGVAETQYRKALRQAKRDGVGPLEQADLYNQLGRSLYQSDQLAASREVYQKGLDLHASSGNSQTTDAAAAWYNLAHVHSAMGQLKEAEFAYKQCAEIERKVLGDESIDLAVTLAQLGTFLATNKEYERADPYMAEAVAIRRQHKDAETADSLKEWAINRYRLSDYEQAIALAQEAIALSTEADTVRGLSFNVIAMSYESKADYVQAGANYRYALRVLRDALGFEHDQFKTVAGNYADMAIDHDPVWGTEAAE